MSPRPILTLVCGQPPDALRTAHGDYVAWLRAALGSRAELEPHRATAQPMPNLRDFAGILITGSEASLVRPEPWMEVAVELIREATFVGVPVLGICFGHQLVAVAHGAPTIRNPRGPEIGSTTIHLTPHGQSDPLFAGLPSSFLANLTHEDAVEPDGVRFGNGLRLLAGNETTPVQALAAGDAVRSVQFHPEFTAAITRGYQRNAALAEDAVECEMARGVLDNWLHNWVLRS